MESLFSVESLPHSRSLFPKVIKKSKACLLLSSHFTAASEGGCVKGKLNFIVYLQCCCCDSAMGWLILKIDFVSMSLPANWRIPPWKWRIGDHVACKPAY